MRIGIITLYLSILLTDTRTSNISPPPAVGRRRATSPGGGVMERVKRDTAGASLGNHVTSDEGQWDGVHCM